VNRSIGPSPEEVPNLELVDENVRRVRLLIDAFPDTLAKRGSVIDEKYSHKTVWLTDVAKLQAELRALHRKQHGSDASERKRVANWRASSCHLSPKRRFASHGTSPSLSDAMVSGFLGTRTFRIKACRLRRRRRN